MRGEDFRRSARTPSGSGSPPHARGRPKQRPEPYGEHRITPACAGKTRASSGLGASAWDHPRMRGEDSAARRSLSKTRGSPPHARGRLRRLLRHADHPGITPACAGKTHTCPCPSRRGTDHPRMRGEDALITIVHSSVKGSPPHARGRQHAERVFHALRRITPACAGKTRPCRHVLGVRRDHPRMRGEDLGEAEITSTYTRITPACAGKT